MQVMLAVLESLSEFWCNLLADPEDAGTQHCISL